ncbi:hypothetical protein E2562_034288 [Oryza meyeriana var. granulata]|uniref:Uncharacterized protein n=1 Tax=Oryza meyeriana var. granulata TaxID=110450 RepID=A0A6G1D966_9ORYZ|nr:hypothetical protein E2562_034288 [Oryza meyeriana var. granulata]KAF0909296.1 hypothetical protein E2562_034288 [Oryza meyeriana var. granulata]
MVSPIDGAMLLELDGPTAVAVREFISLGKLCHVPPHPHKYEGAVDSPRAEVKENKQFWSWMEIKTFTTTRSF